MKVRIALKDSGTGSDSTIWDTEITEFAIHNLRHENDSADFYQQLMEAIKKEHRECEDIPDLNLTEGGVWAHGQAIAFMFYWKDSYFGKQFMVGFVYTKFAGSRG